MKELDVRPIIPKEKHVTIFKLLDALDRGEILQITNDHDPKPLYYQLEAERKGEFNFEYIEDGPDVWKVNILKNV